MPFGLGALGTALPYPQCSEPALPAPCGVRPVTPAACARQMALDAAANPLQRRRGRSASARGRPSRSAGRGRVEPELGEHGAGSARRVSGGSERRATRSDAGAPDGGQRRAERRAQLGHRAGELDLGGAPHQVHAAWVGQLVQQPLAARRRRAGRGRRPRRTRPPRRRSSPYSASATRPPQNRSGAQHAAQHPPPAARGRRPRTSTSSPAAMQARDGRHLHAAAAARRRLPGRRAAAAAGGVRAAARTASSGSSATAPQQHLRRPPRRSTRCAAAGRRRRPGRPRRSAVARGAHAEADRAAAEAAQLDRRAAGAGPRPSLRRRAAWPPGASSVTPRVAEAERLEPGQLVDQLQRHLAGRQHGVDPHPRLQVVVGQARAGVRGQRVGERVDRGSGRSTARRRRGGRRTAAGAPAHAASPACRS